MLRCARKSLVLLGEGRLLALLVANKKYRMKAMLLVIVERPVTGIPKESSTGIWHLAIY